MSQLKLSLREPVKSTLMFDRRNIRRAFALTTALCCFWLSTVGSLMHTHGLPGSTRRTDVAASASRQDDTAVSAAQLDRAFDAGGNCAACEWQSNSVSSALAGL